MDEKKSDFSYEIMMAIQETDKSNRPYDGTLFDLFKKPVGPRKFTIYEDEHTWLYATVIGLLNREIVLHYVDKVNNGDPIKARGKSEKFLQMVQYIRENGQMKPGIHLEVGVDFTLIYPNTQNLDVPKEMFYRKNIGRGVKTFVAYEDKDNDVRIIIRNNSSDNRYIWPSVEVEYKGEEVCVERLSKRFCDIWHKYISYRKPISEKLDFGVDYVIAMSNEKI